MAGVRVIRFFRRLLDVDDSARAAGKMIQVDVDGETHVYVDPPAGGGGGATTLAALTDVSGGPPANGEAPVWDGDSFELTNVATQAELDALAGTVATDHGALTGLADDDHPQYHNDARGDARYQPLDSDLTAIALLSTTAFGRALLTLANQAALLSAAGAAAASHAHAGEEVTSGIVADTRIAATIARDSEVTAAVAAEASARDAAISAAIAVLIDSSPGLLDTLNEIAAALGDDPNFATTMTTALAGKQPLDSDLTAIAALTTTAYGRSLLEAVNAGSLRTLAGLVIGTDVQAQDAELAAIAGLTSAADKLPYFTGSGTAALADLSAFIRTVLDDGDAVTARATLGVIASLFQSGGAQAIKLDDFAAPDDNTDLNASTTKHGLLPKLSNVSTEYLSGTGVYSVPAGAGGASSTDNLFLTRYVCKR